ncbi:cadherin-related family member 2-like, partial [Octopus sinensis]|uniref:Cadherin-related family member 2-like n=1 Tax=Octopus sinensis TaxID=2607531 RepID=A0A6P7U7D4_9MOLL
VEYSKFSLSLKTLDGKPFTALKVIPVESVIETTIALSVNNPDELDYEKEKQMTFKIVAEDKASSKASEANVTLEILPVDEFLPQFSQQKYQVNVSEDKTVGNLITITATDDDSGKDGEVTYAIFGDNSFTIDSKSGTISVSKKLDYEKVTFYSLLVEATDGGNRKATVDLDVFVKGINDNAPIFRPKFYTGLLKEGKTSFEYEITVQATDADKENSGNSQVKYSIVNASQVLSNSFSINAQNGIITPSNIDYESLTDNVIQLVVKAEDNGKPVKEDTAVVNITVLRPESPGAANSNEKNFTSITTVTVVLVFIFIITMLLSHADNQRYSRELRAAKTTKKQSIGKSEDVYPGTNLFSDGQINPLYNNLDENDMGGPLPEKESLNSDINNDFDGMYHKNINAAPKTLYNFDDDTTYSIQADNSKSDLDSVIKERDAEMNKINNDSTVLYGNSDHESDVEATEV